MALIRTIENDAISPFGEPEVPPAEWTYRAWRDEALAHGPMFLRAYLGVASQNAGRAIDSMPEWPRARSLAQSVHAFVNDGRWLWACPICGAAQVASADDKRAFCIECFNAGDGWWPVEWPDDSTRAAGEVVLSHRPSDAQRNWNPKDETVRDLQNENLQHGINPDAPGHEMIDNPVVLAQLKAQLDALGFPMIEGPEDELLTLPEAQVQAALEARLAEKEAQRALDAAEDAHLALPAGGTGGLDDA